MKKMVGIVALLFIVLIGGIVALATIDINRFGKDRLYVQIGEYANVEETRLDSGQIAKRYWYDLPSYDENGEMIKVEFSAAKELRMDAYLMLYVKKGNAVTSYDEVKWEEIPIQARKKLGE